MKSSRRKFKMLEKVGLDRPAERVDKKMGRKEEFEMVSKKYPEYPRTFLIETDCLRRGFKLTKEAWDRFQEPEFREVHDISPRMQFQWHGEDQSIDIPPVVYFNDGTQFAIRLNPPERDPYTLHFEDSKFWVMSDDEKLEEAYVPHKSHWYYKETSSGWPMQNILSNIGFGDAFCCPNAHCHYWNTGDQCKFCDLVYNTKHNLKMGKKFRTRVLPEDLYETTCEWLKGKPGYARSIFINGGTDPREDFQRSFQYYLDMIEAIIKAGKDTIGKDFIVPVHLLDHPYGKDRMIQLKEAGALGFDVQLEIWDEEKFKLQCPGKYKNLGRDRWLKGAIEVAEVFGEGNAVLCFVSGIEMAPPPYGFESIDEAVNSTLEGIQWGIDHGLAPGEAANWAIEPGSYFYKIGASPPPLEFYAKLDLGRYRLQKGTGLSSDAWSYRYEYNTAANDFQRLL